MTSEQITEKTIEILDHLEECDELKIECKDGAIWVRFNAQGKLECTYMNRFGHQIFYDCLKKATTDTERLMIIATHVLAYSEKISGIVFLKLKNKPN